jgi:hypothetical protein
VDRSLLFSTQDTGLRDFVGRFQGHRVSAQHAPLSFGSSLGTGWGTSYICAGKSLERAGQPSLCRSSAASFCFV